MPAQEVRQRTVRGLHAVSQFRSAKFKPAIDAFLELNINPAKVVALYPENVSGRLGEPEEEWIHLFGGPAPPKVEKSDSAQSIADDAASIGSKAEPGEVGNQESTPIPPTNSQRSPSPHGSVRGFIRTGLESIRPSLSLTRDDDTASIRAKRKDCKYQFGLFYS